MVVNGVLFGVKQPLNVKHIVKPPVLGVTSWRKQDYITAGLHSDEVLTALLKQGRIWKGTQGPSPSLNFATYMTNLPDVPLKDVGGLQSYNIGVPLNGYLNHLL